MPCSDRTTPTSTSSPNARERISPPRGTTLAVTSDDPALRERILNLFTQFYGLLRSGHALQSSDLEQGLQLLESDPGSDLRRSFRDEAVLSLPKKTVTARNAAQRAYLERCAATKWSFPWDRPEPARPTLPWRWPCICSTRGGCAASS